MNDSERIDWLEKRRPDIDFHAEDDVRIFTGTECMGAASTLRAAIDRSEQWEREEE